MGPLPVGVSIEIRDLGFLARLNVTFATFLPIRILAGYVDDHLV